MSTTDQRTLKYVADVFYAAFNSGDVTVFDQVVSPEWVDNTLPSGRSPGHEGLKQALTLLRSAIPDLVCTIEDMLFDGNKIIARITFSGTHQGNFLGAPATGNQIRFIAFDIHQISNGQIGESWHLEDNLSFLQQVGIIPPLQES
jgi:steroid delta-isomerase-like uncharacterized protein